MTEYSGSCSFNISKDQVWDDNANVTDVGKIQMSQLPKPLEKGVGKIT